jgi:hypothetical protein
MTEKRRGRPPGAKNKKTILKEEFQALMVKEANGRWRWGGHEALL